MYSHVVTLFVTKCVFSFYVINNGGPGIVLEAWGPIAAKSGHSRILGFLLGEAKVRGGGLPMPPWRHHWFEYAYVCEVFFLSQFLFVYVVPKENRRGYVS